jgi:hypothetical protein
MDGRIVMISTRKYPSAGYGRLMAMRIDGTKSELYYRSLDKKIPKSRGWESPNGIFYFVEGESGDQGDRNLVSVDHGHPLSSWEDVSEDIAGKIHSIYPVSASKLYVSYLEKEGANYSLYSFDTKNRKVEHKIYADPEFHLIEPVVAQLRQTPMKLPPVVDGAINKGTLLCHDTDLSMISPKDTDKEEAGPEAQGPDEMKTSKVQVFGLDGLLGEVAVEEDGSFYIEIDADMPVRFKTLNARGKVLRGPSSWVWVRPNERRSCIGCHEDRELSPDNRVPDALYNGMVSLPEGTKAEPVVISNKYEEL